jgi:hypothetical protein
MARTKFLEIVLSPSHEKKPLEHLGRFMHFDDAQPIMDSLTKMLGYPYGSPEKWRS